MNITMSLLKKIFAAREFIILFIIIIGGLIIGLFVPVFLSAANLQAILLGLSIEAIVACGMTILLVSGGFDLSVGSSLALSGIVTALIIKSGIPVFIALAGGICTAGVIGLLNGLIVSKIGINPFITTLGMMSVARGLVLVVSEGIGIAGLPASFTILGQGYMLGIQSIIWIMLVFVVSGDFLLRHSRFFRQNYYIGGNERAARLSGINVENIKIFNYVLSGLLAGIAGVLFTARLGNASVTAGAGLELRVIAAVVIGGASLSGGEGTILGAFLGTLLMTVITNALNLFGVDVYWQSMVIGGTLLVAVILDTIMQKKKS